MSIGTSTAAVSELVTMFDHVLEEHGFGWDHWHSLLWNLHNVEPEQWAQLPPGGGRTIAGTRHPPRRDLPDVRKPRLW